MSIANKLFRKKKYFLVDFFFCMAARFDYNKNVIKEEKRPKRDEIKN